MGEQEQKQKGETSGGHLRRMGRVSAACVSAHYKISSFYSLHATPRYSIVLNLKGEKTAERISAQTQTPKNRVRLLSRQ